MTSLCTYSLIATIPPDIDETYRKDLVSAVLDDRVEEPAISSNTIGHVDSGVGLKEISPSGCVPFIACDYLRLSPTPSVSFERSLVRLVAVFCPSSLVASARQQTQQHNQRNDDGATEEPSRRLAVDWYDEPVKLSKILLSMIHPFLAQNFAVRAILTNQNIDRNPGRPAKQNAPCDVVILNLSHCPYETIVDELLEVTNCEAIHSGSEAILKVLLLSKLEFGVPSHLPIETSEGKPITASTVDTRKSYASTIEIPVCAVCLFRIDPSRLGLPRPPSHRLCSKFCTTPSKFTDRSSFSLSCPRQRLLLPWPPPNHCETCHIIRNYWMKYSDNTAAYKERDEVFCNLCGMQETLWVCLTCAFVGCGRYSNKHAAEHNDTTRHPFCLELSTLRIWSYVDSEFVHRVDLLECPASLQNVHQLPGIVPGRLTSTPHSSIPPNAALCLNGKTSRERISLGNQDLDHKNRYLTSFADPPDFGFQSRLETDHYERMVASSFASVDEKTPKKATMIGEEYEVLLQSALEDQAQYYEGEIAWLRATLSAEQVDRKTLAPEEAAEIQNLGLQNSQLRVEIENVGRELLDAQKLEATYRASSQRLLHEQSITQNLLKKVKEESQQERDHGQLLIEDLELQVSDLKANQRMMQQFSQNEDLKNSQILGAERQISDSGKPTTGSRNKKSKKFSRLPR